LFLNRQEFIMNEFFKSNGIKNIKKLTAFIHNFIQKPAAFFDLTEKMEQKFGEALAFFRD